MSDRRPTPGVVPGSSDRPRLLVTGGAGMVGRNVVEHPAFADWTIAAPTRRDVDLTDYAATLAYMRDFRPDFVVHAAGRVGGIQANMAAPVAFMVDNVDIGRNVVLAASRSDVRNLLNLGSSCMYPRDGENPLREESVLAGPLEPTNEGYAIAKIYTQRLCEYLRREDQTLRYKTFLPCNLYGRYDHFDTTRSHLLPAIIVKIHEAKASGAETVEIWGDGTARREFMYAGDLADAIAVALADFDAVPDLMNVGPGSDHTILEYYEAVRDAIGWTGRFTFDLTKPTGMRRKLVDITRQRQWNWTPRTSLSEGIAQTYRYFLGARPDGI